MGNSPTRSNSSNMSKSPAVSNLPTVDNSPSMNNSPDMNNMSSMEKLPDINGSPDMNNSFTMNSLPGMDTLPTMDNLPDANNLPAMNNLPPINNSADNLPAINNSTGMDNSIGIDNSTGMGNLPDINNLPGVNSLSDTDSLPTMGNSPAMSSPSTINNNSTIGIDCTPLYGGCACGYARYRITAPFLLVHCCYCTACQRQTGSAFSLNGIIERYHLKLMSGEPPSIAGTPTDPTPVPTDVQPAFAALTNTNPASNVVLTAQASYGVCIPTESGVGQTVWKCPRCSLTTHSSYADGGPALAYVRVGTLDRPWEIKPGVHIYTRSRPSWLAANDDKPSFDGYYPNREELMTEVARLRYEAIKPLLQRVGKTIAYGWFDGQQQPSLEAQ
ncbi:uncharacterized protein FIESC28_07601 [Fusarium coffeatum]|uniref:CENP-V/GFA domain-containing protein n=1 Tax=Fusarium coffeatum TaxID=231269 RepID=A0A366RBU1_9HYPO|nr:uncharacterized protein FIESC28_07601 [Fusarium coffeatum]RBR14623.1 hypothetical protein FIESC28_07601 [Fusarium coffeatum]